MRKTIYIYGILVIVLLISCQKYEMPKYEEEGRINFMAYDQWGYERDDPSYFTWTKNFGINKLGENLLVDTVKIGVKITGDTVSYPRKVAFKVRDITEEGVKIRFLDNYVVPAGTGKAAVKLIVERPAQRNLVCRSELEFDYEQSDFKRGTVERQIYKFEASDVVNMELLGINEAYWNDYPVYFVGNWSETKARFIITTLGITSFATWDPWGDAKTLYKELEKYKANPANPPLYDETKLPDKVWISFPD